LADGDDRAVTRLAGTVIVASLACSYRAYVVADVDLTSDNIDESSGNAAGAIADRPL